MRLIIWVCLALISLTSCSTIAPLSTPPTKVDWKKRQETLSSLHNWQINGKIAVQTAHDSGSATIDWTQNQDHYTISLLGPLGSNGLKLSGRPGRVTIQNANGSQSTASSPEQLLAKQWGWNVPVSSLKYWIRGIPVPGVPANSQYDSYHRISDLVQQGSHIQYLSYTNTNGIELPQKIYITSPNINTKIIIYQWSTY